MLIALSQGGGQNYEKHADIILERSLTAHTHWFKKNGCNGGIMEGRVLQSLYNSRLPLNLIFLGKSSSIEDFLPLNVVFH